MGAVHCLDEETQEEEVSRICTRNPLFEQADQL
ncbi:hypothetical protein CD31A_0806 [Corynebacterium diphtheriae 31A]|nr:hypothetical protein CD31A_0806 [Corynebacterium diphtheriae 31A]